jgi:hypothetical protein
MSSLVKYWLPVGCLLFISLKTHAQSTATPLRSPAYDLLKRLEIKTAISSPIHPELKPGFRQDATIYALKLDSVAAEQLSNLDRADIHYLLMDNNEFLSDSIQIHRQAHRRGLFRNFYRTPANLFELNTSDFHLRVNPMFNFYLGREPGDSAVLFQNHRGLEIRGDLDKKLFFYTNVVESQARFPSYVTQRVRATSAVPGIGFFKGFKSKLLGVRDAYDFNVATAYLGFQATRHFAIQLGHGKHFIGNGYRSMLLSDFSAPAFYLKLDTRVWRFHYQNLFLELSSVSQVNIPDGILLPKKYAAIHYLNYKASPQLTFGFFEATIFNRSRQFELQYLNPVVFYRTVEGMIGSPDNVLLGLDGRWNLLRRLQLYGQFMLDELVVSEIFSRSGWWGNKWGIQAGVHYVNAFGIEHLDIQLEHNRARPFTYAHSDPANSYTHYNQPLAHPLGSNFEETLLLLRWSPVARLTLQARFMLARLGDNTATENWGANPLINYDTRVQDFGNEIGQGARGRINLVGLDASWALWHNLFADLKFLYRKKASVENTLDLRTQVFGLGLRMNLWNQDMDF